MAKYLSKAVFAVNSFCAGVNDCVKRVNEHEPARERCCCQISLDNDNAGELI
jgi:hypothetical protein